MDSSATSNPQHYQPLSHALHPPPLQNRPRSPYSQYGQSQLLHRHTSSTIHIFFIYKNIILNNLYHTDHNDRRDEDEEEDEEEDEDEEEEEDEDRRMEDFDPVRSN